MKNISKEFVYGIVKDGRKVVNNLNFLDLVRYILLNDIDFDKITYSYKKNYLSNDFFIGEKKEFLEKIIKENVLEKYFRISDYLVLLKNKELLLLGSRKDIIDYLSKNELDDLVLSSISNKVLFKGKSEDIIKHLNDQAHIDVLMNLYYDNVKTMQNTKKSHKINKISKFILILLGIVNIYFMYQIFILPLSILTFFNIFASIIVNLVVLPNVINYERESKISLKKHDISKTIVNNLDKIVIKKLGESKQKYTYQYNHEPLNIEECKESGNKTLNK